MVADLDALGRFDVVLFLGVLYHLQDPLGAMRRLARVTGELAVIESEAVAFAAHEDRALCEFFAGDELAGDPTNWWVPEPARPARPVRRRRLRRRRSDPGPAAGGRTGSPPLPGDRARAPVRLPRHIPELDGVRALVVLSIALFHITLAVGWRPNHELPAALQSSWFFSVEFLFVLAGLVAFAPVVRNGTLGSVRAYALRRAGRILPLYYLSAAGGAAARRRCCASMTRCQRRRANLEALSWPTCSSSSARPIRCEEGFGVHGIVWAMSILVLFYVLFPAVARRYLQHPLAGLALAALITAGWHVPGRGRPQPAAAVPASSWPTSGRA